MRKQICSLYHFITEFIKSPNPFIFIFMKNVLYILSFLVLSVTTARAQENTSECTLTAKQDKIIQHLCHNIQRGSGTDMTEEQLIGLLYKTFEIDPNSINAKADFEKAWNRHKQCLQCVTTLYDDNGDFLRKSLLVHALQDVNYNFFHLLLNTYDLDLNVWYYDPDDEKNVTPIDYLEEIYSKALNKDLYASLIKLFESKGALPCEEISECIADQEEILQSR